MWCPLFLLLLPKMSLCSSLRSVAQLESAGFVITKVRQQNLESVSIADGLAKAIAGHDRLLTAFVFEDKRALISILQDFSKMSFDNKILPTTGFHLLLENLEPWSGFDYFNSTCTQVLRQKWFSWLAQVKRRCEHQEDVGCWCFQGFQCSDLKSKGVKLYDLG
jgi:hypothetical protein